MTKKKQQELESRIKELEGGLGVSRDLEKYYFNKMMGYALSFGSIQGAIQLYKRDLTHVSSEKAINIIENLIKQVNTAVNGEGE
jgi:hypothetical protein